MTGATAQGVPAALPPIDFHVQVEHAVGYACRVVRKARSAGCTVLVHSADTERLARMDQALWTFSVLDFLPHVDAHSPLAGRTPVWLSAQAVVPPDGAGNGSAPATVRDVLLLLDEHPVQGFRDWFPAFGRVIDLVEAGEGPMARGRERFRAYREAGFAPRLHEIPTQ
jgi:DNA polymerase-3 subunit chi